MLSKAQEGSDGIQVTISSKLIGKQYLYWGLSEKPAVR